MKMIGKLTAFLALAALLTAFVSLPETIAQAENYENYAGHWYSCEDPWGGRFYVTVKSVEDGRISWSFSDVFFNTTLYQQVKDAPLNDGETPFHLEGTSLYDEDKFFRYDGTLALRDGAVVLAFTAGALEERSPEGGSSSQHVDPLEEADRVFVLNRRGAVSTAVADRFSDTWVADGLAVELWYDGGTFHCHAVQGDGGDESSVIVYTFAEYDEARDLVICEDGIRTLERWNNESEELDSETGATGLTAVFRLDEQDRLIYGDSEGIFRDAVLKRLSVAEDEEGE